MKRLFFFICLLVTSFLFISPNKTLAASCASQNGKCDLAASCSIGSPIVSDDCGFPSHCCPIITATCASLGGHCDTAASCSIGSPLSGTCGAFQVCCPTITATCASLGGHCDTAYTCSQGSPLLGTCGAFQVCCPNINTTNNGPYCNGNKDDGINTALGCIKIGSGEDLVVTILRIATGLGGGIALALILYGVFIITTSAGMPDKLKAGSEIITSAIIGLIFILLSVFLVNLIGINILGIPGLT